jgi:hypothetical protein
MGFTWIGNALIASMSWSSSFVSFRSLRITASRCGIGNRLPRTTAPRWYASPLGPQRRNRPLVNGTAKCGALIYVIIARIRERALF